MTAHGPDRGLERLEREIRAQGGLLAAAARPVSAEALAVMGPGLRPGRLAAAGPRAAGAVEEYELLVDLMHEGYLLHYGSPRVVLTEDPDLRLLAGDELYALGLVRLSGLGDLQAVRELADVISLCAQAHAAADPALAEAVWVAGALAVGWGSSPAHAAAKEAARTGEPGARERLRAVADGGEVAHSR